jgi:hypothetical protein
VQATNSCATPTAASIATRPLGVISARSLSTQAPCVDHVAFSLSRSSHSSVPFLRLDIRSYLALLTVGAKRRLKNCHWQRKFAQNTPSPEHNHGVPARYDEETTNGKREPGQVRRSIAPRRKSLATIILLPAPDTTEGELIRLDTTGSSASVSMSCYNNNHNSFRKVAGLAGYYEHACRRSSFNKVRYILS